MPYNQILVSKMRINLDIWGKNCNKIQSIRLATKAQIADTQLAQQSERKMKKN